METQTPPKNYGALMLAAGLGFAAGFLISSDQGKRKSKPRRSRAECHPSEGGRARSAGDSNDYWDDHRRLETRRSSDMLALTGPSVRGAECLTINALRTYG